VRHQKLTAMFFYVKQVDYQMILHITHPGTTEKSKWKSSLGYSWEV